jgi:putative peptide zinc metalloprotease protein
MPTLAESLIASSSRPLALKVRADLTASQQRYLGRTYWVVKEPVGLKYFRFQEEEYAILQMLDGETSLDQIKDRFEEEFAPQKISYQNLQQFVGMLHRSGLVVAEVPDQGKQLKRRGDDKRNKEFLGSISNVLALRWKGIDPEWLLNVIYPYTKWLFSPITMFLWCVVAISALSLVLIEMDVFVSRLPAFHEFFGPGNWLLLGLTLAVTKVLHEFGHGLSCKHYGGECHEMGFMLLVLTPCLYCNVSDSWMLPSKWKRAFIGFAGMYVEIFLASVATFVWWFSEPGMLNHLALRVMFISSVSTILFNGNPLLRYDGYYILADLLEVPNMRQKATNVLQRFIVRWALGIKMPEDPFLPQSNRFLFGMYTVAATAYRWVVVFSILWFLNKVFEPYGLKIIGQLIGVAGLFGLVVMPLWKFGKFLYIPGRMDQVKMPHVYVTVSVMAALVLGILLIPLPHRVRGTAYVRPRDAVFVYAPVDGRLQELNVRAGQQVSTDDVLGRMVNLEVEQRVAELEGQCNSYRIHLESLDSQRFTNPEALADKLEVERYLAAALEQKREWETRLHKMTFVAEKSGTVIPAAEPRRPEKGRLPQWSGQLLSPKNLGAALAEGDAFCQIGDPNDLEAVVIIDQSDIEFVAEGQTVRIKLDAYPGATFESRLENIAEIELDNVPAPLSQAAGGSIATQTNKKTNEMQPLSTSYQAIARLDLQGERLRNGMIGRAKIYTDWRPLGAVLWRFFMETFNFQM